MSSIYDDYERLAIQYKNEYGENTVVVYQLGGFFEIYSIDNGLVDIKGIADILNIQVSKKNKDIESVNRVNCLMAGWPIHAMSKFIPILVKHNYTIVIVEQFENTDPTQKAKFDRKVTQVVSKGTYLDSLTNEQQTIGNYLMCVYMEYISDYKTNKQLFSFGLTVLESSTGQTHCFEVASKENDPNLGVDELYRIKCQYPPSEIIFISNSDPEIKAFYPKLVQCLKLQSVNVINCLDLKCKDVFKVHHQNFVISKVFNNIGLLSPIEFVNLEKNPNCCISYVYLLQYLFNHNENLLSKLSVPKNDCFASQKLVLSHNSADQLDLNNDFLKYLNKCVTTMGKRYFRHQFFNPISNVYDLRNAYDSIEEYRNKGIDWINEARKDLKYVYDIERLFRRVSMLTASSDDLCNIYTSVSILNNYIDPASEDLRKTCTDLLSFLHENINVNSNTSLNIFNEGIFENYDLVIQQLSKNIHQLHSIVDHLNNTFENKNYFKLVKTDRDGYYLTCTNARFLEINKSLQSFKCDNFDYASIKVTKQTSNVKITHKFIDELSNNIKFNEESLNKCIKMAMLQINEKFSGTYNKSFDIISKFACVFDYQITGAYLSLVNHYCKPEIEDLYEQDSFIHCENLRHPIVELIDDSVQFVGNNIELCQKGSKGLLLYGLNAAGKSTLMKSIALCVIMAQSGMYVPASQFKYFPYNSLFTRITKGDDISNGQSTFMIEIQELRNIFKRSNRNSLVIGDELCSGTESASAIGIVSAGLHTLSLKNNCTYVFASHFHDLTSVPEIKELESLNKLKIKHLHVEYDPVSGKLIYDRKLRDGQGLTTYGIEVCKALNISHDFITHANNIRQHYMERTNTTIENNRNVNFVKSSRYNVKAKLLECAICKTKGTEMHHIHHQKDANELGYIGNVKKNRLFNLVSLCEKCHDKTHNDELIIHGYIKTSNGIELNFETNKNKI